MAQKGIHHAIVAVESVDRAFRWIGAAGNANPDGTPIQEDSIFWIASVTKLHIAATIFKLIERGSIDLTSPIATYLTPSLISGIHRLDGVDHTEGITVQHLLGHTSGPSDYFDESPGEEPSLIDRVLERDQAWTLEDILRIVREDLTPHFPPQSLDTKHQKIHYSDTNYQLLIAIIEAVTGQPLHQVFEAVLYTPLGLTQTLHPDTVAEPSPQPATVWAEEQALDIPLAMTGFRDLNSTADDLLTFMRALVRGELFDAPATLDLMMGSWNSFPVSLNPAPSRPTWPIQYGLGMMRMAIPRIFSPLRPIPPVVGHTGVSGSWLFYSPPLDLLLAGTVDQLAASAVPFRFLPRLLGTLAAAAR